MTLGETVSNFTKEPLVLTTLSVRSPSLRNAGNGYPGFAPGPRTRCGGLFSAAAPELVSFRTRTSSLSGHTTKSRSRCAEGWSVASPQSGSGAFSGSMVFRSVSKVSIQYDGPVSSDLQLL